jgi:hypothetical protein
MFTAQCLHYNDNETMCMTCLMIVIPDFNISIFLVATLVKMVISVSNKSEIYGYGDTPLLLL